VRSERIIKKNFIFSQKSKNSLLKSLRKTTGPRPAALFSGIQPYSLNRREDGPIPQE